VYDHVLADPGRTQNAIEEAIDANHEAVRETLEWLVAAGRMVKCPAQVSGRVRDVYHAIPVNHAS
jgi:hypothetical protein